LKTQPKQLSGYLPLNTSLALFVIYTWLKYFKFNFTNVATQGMNGMWGAQQQTGYDLKVV
jgi:hypothetical protein